MNKHARRDITEMTQHGGFPMNPAGFQMLERSISELGRYRLHSATPASIWPKALFLWGSYPAEADTLNRPNVRRA